ncbi:hypothetical protein, partial [Serratia entomophila]
SSYQAETERPESGGVPNSGLEGCVNLHRPTSGVQFICGPFLWGAGSRVKLWEYVLVLSIVV